MKAFLIFFLATLTALAGTQIDFGSFDEECGITFLGYTQIGEMKKRISVCTLSTNRGRDTSLFVITTHQKEFPPRVVKVLNPAHAPIIEEKEEKIRILYSAGVNTTCVAIFSIENGLVEFETNETIAWNDQGVYRKSESFAQYEHLLKKRKHN